jgi:hypothetical protein
MSSIFSKWVINNQSLAEYRWQTAHLKQQAIDEQAVTNNVDFISASTPPSPPIEIRVESTGREFIVRWSHPLAYDGEILGYMVNYNILPSFRVYTNIVRGNKTFSLIRMYIIPAVLFYKWAVFHLFSVSDWLLFNVNWAVCHLYSVRDWLLFNVKWAVCHLFSVSDWLLFNVKWAVSHLYSVGDWLVTSSEQSFVYIQSVIDCWLTSSE